MNTNNLDFSSTLQEWAALFARRSIHEFQQFTREQHLNMPQISVMMRLYYSGPTTIHQIRSDTVGSRAATSQMIDDLVQHGWVERVESPVDRRMKVVSLTVEGRSLVDQGIAARRKWLGQLSEAISPELRAEITEVLRTMINTAADLESTARAKKPISAEG